MAKYEQQPLPPPPTDDQIVDEWIGTKRSAHTRRAYERIVGQFRTFVGRPLDQVATRDIQRWLESQAGAPKSRAQALATIKSLYSYAVDQGYIARSPAKVLKTPRPQITSAERLMTADEATALIEAATNRRDQVLLTLIFHAGLRASEALGLRWRDCRQREQGRGQISVMGKGEKPRQIVLPASTWAKLQELRGDAALSDPVFQSTRDGAALSYRRLYDVVKVCAARAGLGDQVSPHWLRHAHAIAALQRGQPLKVVSETLGHVGIGITGQYLHLLPGESSALAFEEPPEPGTIDRETERKEADQ